MTKDTKPGLILSVVRHALLALSWGILFVIVCMLFNMLTGAFIINDQQFLMKTTWSDTGVILAACLYLSVPAVLFAGFGMALGRRDSAKFWVLLAGVSSYAILGLVIWTTLYHSVKGSTSELNSFAWMLFTVYTFWASPVTELLRSYIPDPNRVKLAGLLISFLPTGSAWLGICLVHGRRNRTRVRRMLGYSALVPAALACALAVSVLLPRQPFFDLKEFPAVDGATAAIPFGQIMLSRLTGVNKPYAENEGISFNTTHNAYVNLIEKKADLILVAGPSAEEEKLAQEHGVKLKLTPVGKEAFIFLVHRDNSVDGLTVGQIQDIYSGKIANWKDVGGEDHRIVAFQREANSGSQTYMESKVMKGLKLADPPMESKSGGMGGLIDAVADYRNSKQAIGYSFYYFASEMYKRDNVKFVSIDGIQPSKANIRNGQYPFTTFVYAVTRDDEPADSPAGRLLEWLQSPEGDRAIADGGFVPLTEGQHAQ
ncbi:PstS family phosphate ABC transporter substrate-binding protein [Paenibacillus puerhi]|uniref:PstS family phosphate ABC transporter substrate-binding protein n=1 Tax=Paenibacillus puerhi TaxID=2692622 RepID=UPI00135B3519|nr:substrate-binding domain-containing protein [Paenibacillus puerhi]